MFRYSIDKTSINFNLTEMAQPPKLGRFALLALVEWIEKYKNRSICVETHGMGADPTVTSFSLSQSIGKSPYMTLDQINAFLRVTMFEFRQ